MSNLLRLDYCTVTFDADSEKIRQSIERYVDVLVKEQQERMEKENKVLLDAGHKLEEMTIAAYDNGYREVRLIRNVDAEAEVMRHD